MNLSRYAAVSSLLLLLLLSNRAFSSQDSSEVLTNATDILALSSERAADSIPISITGVVTAAEPGWGGRFFVQDSSGGVFVNNVSGLAPTPGELVAVSGFSMAGGYAPCVDKPHWRKLGTSQLPAAKTPTIEQFMEGIEDSQRIEMSGVVRSAFTNIDRLGVELVADAY